MDSNKNDLVNDPARILYSEIPVIKDNNEELSIQIRDHYINTKIVIQLPDTPSVSSTLLEPIIEDVNFYEIEDLNLAHLCNVEFVKYFLKCGKFFGYSYTCRLDEENTATFTPAGELCLSLDSSTYHQLGIQGNLSTHILRYPKIRYAVRIDFNASNFISKKKIYQKIEKCLTDCPQVFNFRVAWIPSDEKDCPSSIAKYFHDLGYKVTEREPIVENNLRSDAIIPTFATLDDEDTRLSALEWLGVQSTGCITYDYLIESLQPTIDSTVCLNNTEIEGFYSPQHIHLLIKRLKIFLSERNEATVPWVSLTVYGPQDCCVSWGNDENSFRVNGDNFYVLIITRQKTSIYTIREATKPMRYYRKSSNKN